MSAPNWSDLALAILDGKVAIDGLISSLEALSPEALRSDEEAIRAAFDSAFGEVTAANLKASAEAILEVAKHGGPVGGGAGAELA